MDKYFKTVSILIFILSYLFSKGEVIDIKELDFYDGAVYKPRANIPYTGYGFIKYFNGQNKLYGYYENGKKQGEWVERFKVEQDCIDCGDIKTIGKYKDGLKEGEWKEFYEDGEPYETLKTLMHYSNGEPIGTWIYFKFCYLNRKKDRLELEDGTPVNSLNIVEKRKVFKK